MVAVASAILILFGGQSLDHWITVAGRWGVADGTMIVQEAPASIRSSYESDRYSLTFEYCTGGKRGHRLAVHSKMTTGGPVLQLLPEGVVSERPERASGVSVGRNEWIHVTVDVEPERLHAVARRANGDPLSDAQMPARPGSRGFIRFEASEPGLQLRNIRVVEPDFKPMFDGTTLDGWEIMYPKNPDDPGWVIDNGIVKCRGRRSGWLRTWRAYNNFILRLEYQLPPRGNSGVYIRAPIEGRVSRNGFEVQLLDDLTFYGQIGPADHTGSIYDGIAPEIRVPAPANEWNAIEVLCEGKRVRTTLNGIQLYDARLDDKEKDTNSHVRPLATRRTVGFIGLQDHSTTVQFRNVRIRELR